jgi:hypothetical protein
MNILEAIKFIFIMGLIYYPFILFSPILAKGKFTNAQENWSSLTCKFLKVKLKKL